jgi:carboxypeptidase Taq
MGGLGYFPTYTLGNIHAASLFVCAKSDPAIASAIAGADYAPLLAWLRQNIHAHGSTLDPSDLIQQATSKKPSPEDYIQHLTHRYL